MHRALLKKETKTSGTTPKNVFKTAINDNALFNPTSATQIQGPNQETYMQQARPA
jgi:hypothetical protein